MLTSLDRLLQHPQQQQQQAEGEIEGEVDHSINKRKGIFILPIAPQKHPHLHAHHHIHHKPHNTTTTTNHNHTHTHTRTHHTVHEIDQLEMRQHMILLAMRSGAQRALD